MRCSRTFGEPRHLFSFSHLSFFSKFSGKSDFLKTGKRFSTFLPSCLPIENSVRPTEDTHFYTLVSDGRKEVCYLASGVRLKNLSPPASLKGKGS